MAPAAYARSHVVSDGFIHLMKACELERQTPSGCC